MRFISTRAHGMLDYLVALVLLILPWTWAGMQPGTAVWVPVAVGAALLIYSLLTNYEYGVWRAIDMPTHLWLDILGGAFLAASPWIFGFAQSMYLPHLIVGVVEVLTGLTTESVPSYGATYERGGQHRSRGAHG